MISCGYFELGQLAPELLGSPEHPEHGNRANLALAQAHYIEARAIFMAHGELDKARIVAEAIDQIGREVLSLDPTNGKVRPM